ncbi:MAG: zinc-dependent metalloprotease, partial [Nocardioides sp.]|nr:zinc-dependent metalloprotease [Nocardioides sp.]
MNDNPGDPNENPFKGTPFEQFFSGGMPDLTQIMSQFQAMMGPQDGPVNWQLAKDIARRAIASDPDPSPTERDTTAVADAVRLADLWLDEATDFSSGVQSTAAWSRAQWLESTIEVWKVLVEPIAEQFGTVITDALPIPDEAKGLAGPMSDMLGKLGGNMFGNQIGSALGGLAGEVLTASDIGLPLGPSGTAALLPTNVASFADGLDVSYEDVVLYLSLREAAHQRLFGHVSWLREHLIAAVSDYARGISIDVSGIEEKLSGLNPTDQAAMEEMLNGGLFELKKTPAQQAALARLETTLALEQGWVDEVVHQATADRMPSAVKLREAVRRRRAAGGPAEQTFAALAGLELRPRRLRDASNLWASLRDRQGVDGRD